MPLLPNANEYFNEELHFLVKEVYARISMLSEPKQRDLICSLTDFIEWTIIDSPCDPLIFTTLFALTALYTQTHTNELKRLWKAVALWKHHLGMLLKHIFAFLCTHSESFWLETSCQILSWIESPMVTNMLFLCLFPKNITSRTELQLNNESLAIIEKTKTSAKKSKKKLYEPLSVDDAQLAFVLLLKNNQCDRNNLLLFHSIIFAFDESMDPFIHSLALEYLQTEAESTFDKYLQKLVERTAQDNILEAHLVKYSFDYGCRCTLKSMSILAWKLFSELACGVCTEDQILPSVFELIRNVGKSMRSLEKGQPVLEACLDSIILIAASSESHEPLLKSLIIILLNSPLEALYLKGFSLLLTSNLQSEIEYKLLLRGLFITDYIESENKIVRFYFWLRNLLLLNKQDNLKPIEDTEPTLITLYNRTSLRSQFWPRLVAFAVTVSGKSLLIDFIEAWVQLRECTLNFVHFCQVAASTLPKDTLLSVIDRLADLDADELVDECIKKLIDEFDSREEDENRQQTTNPFLISQTDFDIFQDSVRSYVS